MADSYSVMHTDEFEEMEGSGGATWRLARKSLGVGSFGFNIVDIEPGGQIPEHDETGSGQDEVFYVIQGEGTFVADGEEHPAPAGTFIRYAPEATRTVRNNSSEPIRVLLIGVPADSGYQPGGWN